MKFKISILLLLLFASVTFAQTNGKDNQNIIIKGKVPSDYTRENIEFRTTSLSASIGYRPELTQTTKSVNRNGVFTWQKQASEPLFVRSVVFGKRNMLGATLEPGDNITIRYDNGKILYEGKGAEKLQLETRLEILNDSINDLSLAKGLSDKSLPVTSLEDYLMWNRLLNKKLEIMLPEIDFYKSRISVFAYNNIKVKVLTAIEKQRLDKFFYLRIEDGNVDAVPTSSGELVNQFGLSDENLVSIYDTTLNGAAAKWLEQHAPLVNEPQYYYKKLRIDAYREMNNFFRKTKSDNFVLTRHDPQFWVMLYNMGKRKYNGVIREALLAYIFSDVRGALYYCGFTKEIELLLADYYEQSKYPQYKTAVKDAEIKNREKYSKKNASEFVLTDSKGRKFTKENIEGKIAILDFWFTGCTGCIQMTPALKKVEDAFKQDSNVVFLSISIDRNREQWLKSIAQKKYTTGSGINLYTSGKGRDHEIISRYGVAGYPSIYLIDNFNRLIWNEDLPDPRKDAGEALIALIKSKLPLLKDGPYVFYDRKSPIVYTISGNSVNQKKLVESQTPILEVQTDQYGKTFNVSIRANITNQKDEYPKPKRILALSDIEGNFDAFRKLLISNKVIDQNYQWIFGNGHLVFSGDMFDRGLQVTECLWLVYALEEKAKSAGGYVHFILGNHEIMNLQGNFSYVQQKYKDNAELMNKKLIQLYSEDTELGSWLRTKNVIEKIGDNLFTHGGVSQELNDLSISLTDINNIARQNYSQKKSSENDVRLNVILSDKIGPYWFRGYYQHETSESVVDKTLQKFQVNHIVTGHTIVGETISMHYNGKVFNTDTEHAKGKSEALLIEDGKYYRVNTTGERALLYTETLKNHSN